jgi:hypothetical protein
MSSPEDGDLLPQGKDLERSFCTTTEEDADHGAERENEFDHEFTFNIHVTSIYATNDGCCKLLIPSPTA